MYASFISKLDTFVLGSIDDLVHALIQYSPIDHEVFLVHDTGNMSRHSGRLGSFGVSKNPKNQRIGWKIRVNEGEVLVLNNKNELVVSYDIARNRAYKRTK